VEVRPVLNGASEVRQGVDDARVSQVRPVVLAHGEDADVRHMLQRSECGFFSFIFTERAEGDVDFAHVG
jgi:hypothetical protein